MERSPRGFIKSVLGQQFGVVNRGNPTVIMTIHDIVPGLPCRSSNAVASEHGVFLGVRMTLETTASYDPTPGVTVLPRLDPEKFGTIGPDDVPEDGIVTEASRRCLDDHDRLPLVQLGPGQRHEGMLVLDTRNQRGRLTFRLPEPGLAWQWEY